MIRLPVQTPAFDARYPGGRSKTYQIESQRAVDELAEMAAAGNPAVQLKKHPALSYWIAMVTVLDGAPSMVTATFTVPAPASEAGIITFT